MTTRASRLHMFSAESSKKSNVTQIATEKPRSNLRQLHWSPHRRRRIVASNAESLSRLPFEEENFLFNETATDCAHRSSRHNWKWYVSLLLLYSVCRLTHSSSCRRCRLFFSDTARFFGVVNVQILEGGTRVLTKVCASGGRRCNVTSGLYLNDNRAFVSNYARGSRFMPGILSRHSATDVIDFFQCNGVPLKEEESGKIFPVSDTSADVVNALVQAVRIHKVAISTRKRGVWLECSKPPCRFQVHMQDGNIIPPDFVALTTGDAAKTLTWVSKLGHKIVPQAPLLFSLVIRDPLIHGLQSLSVPNAEIQLLAQDGKTSKRERSSQVFSPQRGPLLITHCGCSGPAVLALRYSLYLLTVRAFYTIAIIMHRAR